MAQRVGRSSLLCARAGFWRSGARSLLSGREDASGDSCTPIVAARASVAGHRQIRADERSAPRAEQVLDEELVEAGRPPRECEFLRVDPAAGAFRAGRRASRGVARRVSSAARTRSPRRARRAQCDFGFECAVIAASRTGSSFDSPSGSPRSQLLSATHRARPRLPRDLSAGPCRTGRARAGPGRGRAALPRRPRRRCLRQSPNARWRARRRNRRRVLRWPPARRRRSSAPHVRGRPC